MKICCILQLTRNHSQRAKENQHVNQQIKITEMNRTNRKKKEEYFCAASTDERILQPAVATAAVKKE